MNLPIPYIDRPEWTLVGPMGPMLPDFLRCFPSMGIDGGAHFLESLDIWVGDKDSFKGVVNAQMAYHFPSDKEASDLKLAFSLFQKPLPYKLHLWGLLGGRKDHEMFNLGEALTFLNKHKGSQIFFYGKDQAIHFHLLSAGEWTISHQGTFSLGCISPITFSLTGRCRYEVKEEALLNPLSSLGLSNMAEGEMTLKTNGAIFLYYPEAP